MLDLIGVEIAGGMEISGWRWIRLNVNMGFNLW